MDKNCFQSSLSGKPLDLDHISSYFHIDTCGHWIAVLSREMTLMSSMWSLSLLVSTCQMELLTGSVAFLSDAKELLVCQSASVMSKF